MLLGDSGVGKTCVLVRFKDGAFLSGSFISTVGIDYKVRRKIKLLKTEQFSSYLNAAGYLHYEFYHILYFARDM